MELFEELEEFLIFHGSNCEVLASTQPIMQTPPPPSPSLPLIGELLIPTLSMPPPPPPPPLPLGMYVTPMFVSPPPPPPLPSGMCATSVPASPPPPPSPPARMCASSVRTSPPPPPSSRRMCASPVPAWPPSRMCASPVPASPPSRMCASPVPASPPSRMCAPPLTSFSSIPLPPSPLMYSPSVHVDISSIPLPPSPSPPSPLVPIDISSIPLPSSPRRHMLPLLPPPLLPPSLVPPPLPPTASVLTVVTDELLPPPVMFSSGEEPSPVNIREMLLLPPPPPPPPPPADDFLSFFPVSPLPCSPNLSPLSSISSSFDGWSLGLPSTSPTPSFTLLKTPSPESSPAPVPEQSFVLPVGRCNSETHRPMQLFPKPPPLPSAEEVLGDLSLGLVLPPPPPPPKSVDELAWEAVQEQRQRALLRKKGFIVMEWLAQWVRKPTAPVPLHRHIQNKNKNK